MFDPQVHLYKTVLMQRLMDSVIRGYCFYTAGIVPLHKAARMADKFAELYAADRNSNQRAYAKHLGRANAKLFLLKPADRTELQWWLCVTAGDGLVHERESLRDARERNSRLRIDDDYELLRVKRSSTKGGGTVWTWRMTHACYDRWRIRIRQACRRSEPTEMREASSSLHRVPGFSGTRRQIGELITFARAEWRRRHGSLDTFPERPKLRFVQRLKNISVPLSEASGAVSRCDAVRASGGTLRSK